MKQTKVYAYPCHRACLRVPLDQGEHFAMMFTEDWIKQGFEAIVTDTVDTDGHVWIYFKGPKLKKGDRERPLHLWGLILSERMASIGRPPHWIFRYHGAYGGYGVWKAERVRAWEKDLQSLPGPGFVRHTGDPEAEGETVAG